MYDRRFSMTVGEKTERFNWKSDKVTMEFQGNLDHLTLKANSVEQAKEILKAADVTIYQIFDDTKGGFSGELVEQSPEITEWEEAQKKEGMK